MLDKIVIGVDLGGTKIHAGRIRQNKIEQEFYKPISAGNGKDEVIQEVIETIEHVFISGVDSIGIGVPGIVDVKNGIVYDVTNIPSWDEVFLKDRLESQFNCPIYINNDANCFVLGEKHFGKARGYSNIVGVTLGTGVGTGIIIHNRLYTGKSCGAGEFGMIPYNGQLNYEYFCSGQFFKEFQQKNGKDLISQAEKKDTEVLKLYRQYGHHIGHLVSAILFTIDPEIIIFGGSIGRAYPYFKDEMWKVVDTFPYKSVTENLKIDVTDAPNIAILGAAALYYDAHI